MTAQEAKNKSYWYGIAGYVRGLIREAVESGKCFVTLPNDETLHYDDHHKLQNLGYYIYFNKATNSHEIRW